MFLLVRRDAVTCPLHSKLNNNDKQSNVFWVEVSEGHTAKLASSFDLQKSKQDAVCTDDADDGARVAKGDDHVKLTMHATA